MLSNYASNFWKMKWRNKSASGRTHIAPCSIHIARSRIHISSSSNDIAWSRTDIASCSNDIAWSRIHISSSSNDISSSRTHIPSSSNDIAWSCNDIAPSRPHIASCSNDIARSLSVSRKFERFNSTNAEWVFDRCQIYEGLFNKRCQTLPNDALIRKKQD